MARLTLVLFVLAAAGCRKGAVPEPSLVPSQPSKAKSTPTLDDIQASERRSMERDAQRECPGARSVFEGGVPVDGEGYVQAVKRGDDFVDEEVPELDRVFAKGKVTFTLDYPFEKPFTGTIEGELTRRKAIDAIRAGFRSMYGASKVNDIPGMANKHVTGAYGEAFHDISDLSIEHLELCDGNVLQISMGS